jgi:glycerol uptake facilitator-like aquaporin
MNAAVVTEFVGTALLLSAIAFTSNPALVIAAFAVAVGFGAKVSGAHINPAVTLFQFLTGKIAQTRALQ